MAENSGRYWLCIEPRTLRIIRRQRMDSGPTLLQQRDGLWFPVGKKLWRSVRAVDVLTAEQLPADVIERLIKRR
jgi:hypothetical protein